MGYCYDYGIGTTSKYKMGASNDMDCSLKIIQPAKIIIDLEEQNVYTIAY